jgi:hypothetical protein
LYAYHIACMPICANGLAYDHLATCYISMLDSIENGRLATPLAGRHGHN